MNQEKIVEVCWSGPYKPSKLKKQLKKMASEGFVLYKIYGCHPIYGDRVLLYIGMTEQGVEKRLAQHDYWMDEERFGESQLFFGSIGPFSTWEASEDVEVFPNPGTEIIKKVEALLILAHQPAHNNKNRKSAELASGIRIFNTNEYGSLFPEVSGKYYDY